MQGYLVINPHQLPTFLVKHSRKTKENMAKMQQRRKDFFSASGHGAKWQSNLQHNRTSTLCPLCCFSWNPTQINLFLCCASAVSKQPTLQATQVATHVPKLQLDYAIQSLVHTLVHTLAHPSLMSGHYQNIRLYWFCNTGQISGGVGCAAGHKLLTCPRDGRTIKKEIAIVKEKELHINNSGLSCPPPLLSLCPYPWPLYPDYQTKSWSNVWPANTV